MIRHQHFLGPSLMFSLARVAYQIQTFQLRLFVLLFAIVAAILHPSQQLASASIPVQVSFWVVGYLVFIFGYRFILIQTVRIATARGWKTIYASGPLELINLVMAVVMYGFARIVGIPTEDRIDLLKFVLFNVALFEIGLAFYIAYANRVIYPEVYDGQVQQPGKTHLREVFLRGSTLPVHSVDYIAAQDDGVIATSGADSVFIPRPFGLVVFELPMDLGFQIHRSLWVSRRLAANFVKDGKRHFILLPDGRRFPIARARRQEYQAWLAQVQNPQAPNA